jgi:hypothetical protein
MLKLRVLYNHPIPKILNVEAITLYPFVIFSQSKQKTSVITIQHEMIHVNQIRDRGFVTFYLSYLCYYLAGLIRYRSHWDAYRFIPYELDAFTYQAYPMDEHEVLEMGLDPRLYFKSENDSPYTL